MGIRDTNLEPYIVVPSIRSPSGADVICRSHIVSEDIKPREAFALAAALNEEFQKRMAL
jgi:hypothetical protein